MVFSLKPTISGCENLDIFIQQWNIGPGDLIITNEYVLIPHLSIGNTGFDTLYQEKYGTGEPSDKMVDSMFESIRGKNYKRVIAIGGGTVIDISKLFVFGDGLTCEEIFSKGAALERKRELIVIPTTCGTGSEVTNISIVEFIEKKTKIGLAIPALFADEAVLIPSLLDSLPYKVFVTSSIDALIHAIESYVSPKTNLFVRANGRMAIELILNGYKKIVADGELKVPTEIGPFLYASTMAGIAFGNAGCAAVHALSYPIGANYHIAHGEANYMMFAKVFEKYKELGADLSDLENLLAGILECSASVVWDEMFKLVDKLLVRRPLREFDVDEKISAEMAASVIVNQQRLLANNPVPFTEKDIFEVYMACI